MTDFVKYVLQEVKSRRLDKAAALSLIREYRTGATTGSVGRLHPLVHRNTSSFERQSFQSTLTGEDFFLKDHVVAGAPVLPAVAYLEMARAAFARSLELDGEDVGYRLNFVAWSQPFTLTEGAGTIEIVLTPEDDGEADFEITGIDGGAAEEPVIHCHGRITLLDEEAPDGPDLAALSSQFQPHPMPIADWYDRFRQAGIDYGPAHRGLEQVLIKSGDRGPVEVLAKIVLPGSVAGTDADYMLHPALLDAALQAGAPLLTRDVEAAMVPFSIEEVDVHAPCPPVFWAWVRLSADSQPNFPKIDIDLLDQAGRVCVRIGCYSTRILSDGASRRPKAASGAAAGRLDLEWAWREASAVTQAAATAFDRIEVLAAGIDAGSLPAGCRSLTVEAGDPARRFNMAADRLLTEVAGILSGKTAGKILLQLVVPNSGDGEAMLGLAGLLKTARLENPKLHAQILQVDPTVGADELDRILAQERAAHEDAVVRHRGGRRFVCELGEVGGSGRAAAPWKTGGVYLVTGGAGGIGLLLADDIAAKAERPALILTGRSDLDAGKAARLDRMREQGAKIDYRRVDVSDAEAVAELTDAIRRTHGRLDGVIHCAGVTRDGYIIRKTADDLHAVLAPKTTGTVALDEATRDFDPDFFVLFSSVSGAFGNPGQADYAAANAFMDAYAGYRNRLVAAGARRGRTLSLGWPLWQDGGMRIDDATREMVERETGIRPMATSTALQAFYDAVAADIDHRIVLEGDVDRIRGLLLKPAVPAARSAVPAAPEKAVTDIQARLLGVLARQLGVGETDIDPQGPFDELGLEHTELGLLADRLSAEFDLPVTAAAIGERETVSDLASWIAHALPTAPPPVSAPSAPSEPSAGSVSSSPSTSPVTVSPSPDEAHAAGDDGRLRDKSVHFFKQLLSSVSKLQVARIDADTAFDSYGVDSVMVMDMTARLEKVFGSLPKTLFFEFQTVNEITAYFLENHGDALRASVGEDKKTVAVPVAASDAKAGQERAPAVRARQPAARRTKRTAASKVSRSRHSSGAHQDGPLDIAIIGLAGRYPQAADLREFWNNLSGGVDSITEIPASRWEHAQFFDAEKDKQGKTYGKWGGFIDGVDEFDALFFNISHREAAFMDPQERLFLQCVHAALEDAGYTRRTLASKDAPGVGGKVGVFVGSMYQEYQLYGVQHTLQGDGVALSGSPASIANRTSYFFNFNGPSITVDTMCSSSLTAIHLACESLVRGTSRVAIAGGVNVSVHPNKYLLLAQGQFLSSNGRCMSFGEGGDGYVPGEGVGAVVLKPLHAAVADGDHIYGVIKGTAINHGGKTNGYSVPSPNAQASVIADALEQSGVEARSISYLEAHGTGTSLGDPIEIAGLSKAFSTGTKDTQFCAIGSAKSNIGHCEGAAGIAGLTKVLLQMKHRHLAPSLNSRTPNPHIRFDETPFVVQQRLEPWNRPTIDQDGRTIAWPRRAGISSFGAGGSNAHLIVEEYEASAVPASSGETVLIVLSAKEDDRLRAMAQDLLNALREGAYTDADLVSIAYTLQTGREAWDHRFATEVDSLSRLIDGLERFIAGGADDPDLHVGNAKRENDLLSRLAGDEDLRQALDLWIDKRKYARLAELWVNGLSIDWFRLYPEERPRRISLPTYPFAKERHWFPSPFRVSTASDMAGAGALHPLLHRNISDLASQRYGATFTGDEAVLADHRVAGRRTLPAAAMLEMARAALENGAARLYPSSSVIRLRDVGWLSPAICDGAPLTLEVSIEAAEDGAIGFEIASVNGQEQRTVHSQGTGEFVPPDGWGVIDPAVLLTRCGPDRIAADALYAAYRTAGIDYGPQFQAIDWIALERGTAGGADAGLVRLKRSGAMAADPRYALPPSLLDAAFQAIAAVSDPDGSRRTASLPFSLDELTVHGSCADLEWVWVKAVASDSAAGIERFDIDLADGEGRVCVSLRGFATRAMSRAAPPALLFSADWVETATATTDGREPGRRHVVLVEREDRIEGATVQAVRLNGATPDRRFIELCIRCLEEIRRIGGTATGAGNTVLQILLPVGPETAGFAGLSGLLKTARQEWPTITFQLVEVDADTRDVDALLRREARQERDLHVRYENGVRHVARWREVAPPTAGSEAWKDNGVYLITGGTGGLGLIFAREIAARVRDPILVLTGRSDLDETKRQAIAEIERSGARVAYRKADITYPTTCRRLVEDILAEFGGLNGVLHCAGEHRDTLLARKTVEEMERVLAAKVSGTVNLDEATADRALDLFVLFSSVAGSLGNVGQGDYAAGNAFMDAYAAYRNRQVHMGRRTGRTLSVGWPLWEAGGMRVGDAVRAMLAEQGVRPLGTQDGIDALHACWNAAVDHCLVLSGEAAKLRAIVSGTVEPEAPAMPAKPAAVRTQPTRTGDVTGSPDKELAFFKGLLSTVTGVPPHRIEPDAAFEKYGMDSVMVMQMTSGLEKHFGPLSKSLLYEYQTLAALTDHFRRNHAEALDTLVSGKDARAATAVTPPAPTPGPTVRAPALPAHRFARRTVASPRDDHADGPLDIAIVGLSGQYPQADNIEMFWENLRSGRDCITEIPAERWDSADYFDPDKEALGKSYGKWGGFLSDVDKFDPMFFNISMREAKYISPQERLFLKCVYETLEDAGYTRESLRGGSSDLPGARVGVFVGVMYEEYQLYGAQQTALGRSMALPGSPASIANRVSYFCNFHGPSLALDTMCSSSLTAIHLACQSILRGECEAAIAGGVNLSIHPNKYLLLSQGRFVSSDGRCRSFGAGGDGYVPGEGVGAVLLKPLARAVADGDQIHGVIKGSALNHGGKTNGYTVPNPAAQAAVVAAALARAGVAAASLGYVEAHGTGTALGDPIEIAGLSRAFGDLGGARCAIGSAKSNIGHCESAAGIAGLTKVLLQMRHGQLAPSLHAESLNPNIDFAASPFVVQRELAPWERPRDHPRRAGISSFGAGGSNAHLIVEEYVPETPVSSTAEPEEQAFVFSAKTPERLKLLAGRMLHALDRGVYGDHDLADIAYTLQVGREAHAVRLGVVAGTIRDLREKLAAFADGRMQDHDLHFSEAGAAGGGLKALSADRDLAEIVDRWVADRKLDNLLRLWVSGIAVDWRSLHANARRRRKSLPTYPFEEIRCWYDDLIGDVFRTSGSGPGKPAAPKSPVPPAPVTEPSRPDAVRTAAPVAASRTPDRPTGGGADHIAKILAEIAELTQFDARTLDPTAPLDAFGVDSIMKMSLIGKLVKAYPGLDAKRDGDALLQYSTVQQFADYLKAHVVPEPDDAVPEDETATDAMTMTPVRGAKRSAGNLVCPVIRMPSDTVAEMSGDIVVDLTHPFFFDHELDHISGMQLAEAMSEVAKAAYLTTEGLPASTPLLLSALQLDYLSVCSLEETARAEISRLASGGGDGVIGYEARVLQAGTLTVRGRLEIACMPKDLPSDDAAGMLRSVPHEPVDQRVVNKVRAENVLISKPERPTDDPSGVRSWLLTEGRADFFHDFPGAHIDGVVLAEAARQCSRAFIYLLAEGKEDASIDPRGMVPLLKTIRLGLQEPVHWSQDVELRQRTYEVLQVGNNYQMDLTGQFRVDGRAVGDFKVVTLLLSGELYGQSTQKNRQHEHA